MGIHTDRICKRVVDTDGKSRFLRLELEVELTGDGRFSAHGHYKVGDVECFGQCLDGMRNELHRLGLVCPKLEAVMEYWPRYHLNDLNAGSPRQMEVVRERKAQKLPIDYDTMCEVLKEKGLYEDEAYHWKGRGYRYGEGWLSESLPQDVVEGIRKAISMPMTLEKAA